VSPIPFFPLARIFRYKGRLAPALSLMIVPFGLAGWLLLKVSMACDGLRTAATS